MFKNASLFLAILLLSCPVALAQESSPDDFKEFLSAWQGHWRGEVPDPNGDAVISHSDCKITAHGKSMVATVYGGDLTGIWFVTYDSHKRRIISQWSQSDGEVGRSELYKDGDKWILKGMGATGDGKRLENEFTITITDSGNTHVWDRKQTIDGKMRTTREEWKRVYFQGR